MPILIQDSHTDAQLLHAHQKVRREWYRAHLVRTTVLVQSKHPSPVKQVKVSRRKMAISGHEGELMIGRVEADVEVERDDIRRATTKVGVLVDAVAPESPYTPLENAKKHSRIKYGAGQ